jgi:hypothetical protein
MARTTNTLSNPFVLTGGSQTTGGGGVRDTGIGGTFTPTTPTTPTAGSFPTRDLNISDINIDSAEANVYVAPNPRITANPNISDAAVVYGDYEYKEYDSSYGGGGVETPKQYNDYDYDSEYYNVDNNNVDNNNMPCPAGQEYIQPNCIQAPCPGYCAPIEGATSPGGPAVIGDECEMANGQKGTLIMGEFGMICNPKPAPAPEQKKITSNLSPLVIGLGLVVGLVVVFKIFKKSA